MTHLRLDPDPLHVEPEPVRRVEPDEDSGMVIVYLVAAILGGLVIALLWLAAPRSAPDHGPSQAALTGQGRIGAPRPAVLVDLSEDLPITTGGPAGGGVPNQSPEASPQPPATSKNRVGWATYCAPTRTRCHGWDTRYVGGVRSFHHGDDPYYVQVCRADRPGTCTHVLVVSYCACGQRHGEPTVIDLSVPAFRELASLSRGIVRVIVSGPIPAPDITLPPTDEETR